MARGIWRTKKDADAQVKRLKALGYKYARVEKRYIVTTGRP